MLTVRAQGQLIENAQDYLPFNVRLLNALVSYVAYLRQMFWPSDLAVLYPHPMEQQSVALGVAAGVLLTGITLAALYWRRRRPYFLVGWLWYLGTLVPVIGLLQVGTQARADRYTYVPLIGIFVALSWGAADWLGRRRYARFALPAITAALLVACTALTWSQVRFWRNSTTLWDRALQISGDDPRLRWQLAYTSLRQGDMDVALAHAEALCKQQPDNPESHRFLATVLAEKGHLDEAVASLTRALALQPDSAASHRELAGILRSQGKIPAADAHYAVVARLEPQSVEGQHYQGILLQRAGKLDDAVRCFAEAVRLDPGGVLHHVDLALALEDQGNLPAAAAAYRRALEINSGWPKYCDRLARILAMHADPSRRDAREAIRLARASCSITDRRYPPFLETLAAAYAEAGLFKQAIATADHGRELAQQAGDQVLVERLDSALRLYSNAQPLRDPQMK